MRAVYSLAVIDLLQGDYEGARRGFRAFVKAEPGHLAAWHNLGVAAQALGRWSEAERAYRGALAIDPGGAESRFALARVLTALGGAADAIAEYRTLAATEEHCLRALSLLGVLAPQAVADAELATLQGGGGPAAGAEAKIAAAFALGSVLDARGDAEGAFSAFAEGNRLKRVQLGEAAVATAQGHARSVAIQKARFTSAALAGRDPTASASRAPVSVVGFPRSGSSLIERILAAHPDVQGMGETGLLSATLERGGDARAYAGAVREAGWRDKSRFIDKTLENYLHIGSIHRMFPKAVIIHATRDPTGRLLRVLAPALLDRRRDPL